MTDLTWNITPLSCRYSCNSYNVTHSVVRRCARKFHSAGEDRSRNKRRAHARPCSYTDRPMATRANARQWVEKR